MPRKRKPPENVDKPVELEDMQQETTSVRTGLRETNEALYLGMITELDKIQAEIITQLRAQNPATELLEQAEYQIFLLEQFLARHRYTFVDKTLEITTRDSQLYRLAEINQLKTKNLWPVGPDGRGHQLSPMQQAALWF